MSTRWITPDLLRLVLFERFHHMAEEEKKAYTLHIQAEKSELMKEHKKKFMDILKERRAITDVLPVPNAHLKDAVTVIQRAIRTRQLEDLYE